MKKRILVIDDEVEIQQLVRVLLTRLGLEIIPAENVPAAVRILSAQPLPDLVILDLMMPDVSGIDFLKQMRHKDTLANVPILVLSALIESDDVRTAIAAGADRYLTKPYIANNLVTIVQEMLKTGRRPRASVAPA